MTFASHNRPFKTYNFAVLLDSWREIPFPPSTASLNRSEVNRTNRKASRLKALAVLRSNNSTQGLFWLAIRETVELAQTRSG